MKSSSRLFKNLCLPFSLIVCGLLFVTYFNGEVAAKETKIRDQYSSLRLFTDVLALIEKNYVEAVDLDELVQGAVRGMLTTLDPHSSYMPQELHKELQVETKGSFGGLGIEITVKDGLLTVVSPIEGSPAVRAGVESGDQIIKIEDEFTKDLSLVDAVKKLRGPKGSPVVISVQREGVDGLIPLRVIRDVIKVKSVRSRILDEGFGYIRLAQFQDGSAREFSKAITRLNEEVGEGGLKGLIVDLRNNPGGLLKQAVRVSDIFLKEGVVVYTEGRLESQKHKYFAHDDGSEPEYPVIMLVNGGSASASEIVAGAMQDHGRAVVLGQQTFGKGSVQTILPMGRGDALRLTTALYFTTSGRSIQSEGVTPDIVVEEKKPTVEVTTAPKETKRRKERDLPGAIKNPNSKPQSKKKEKQTVEEAMEQQRKELRIGSREAMRAELSKLLEADPQLNEALRLLKTWDVFKGRPSLQPGQQLAATVG
ncbi:UNVERIFIED_CONTAM: hypothetical protein GTU68_002520 [Idotea baltica]|nr:hypothetical protein [Idotea baltica]